MKGFVFLGVVLLVACVQVNAQNSQSFLKDFANLTDSMLSSQQDLNNVEILSIKIDALSQTTWRHGINRKVYQSIFDIINNLRWLSSRMQDPDHILKEIGMLQERFDSTFDELNMQRDVDESELPSKINEVVDEFFNRYTEMLVEPFDNMFTQAKHLQENADKLAQESSTIVTSFAENIDKCLALPKTEFKEILQCRQNTRGVVLPNLAHNTAMLSVIDKELKQLWNLPFDGKKSVDELVNEMEREKHDLLGKIQELRDQREAEKENKD